MVASPLSLTWPGLSSCAGSPDFVPPTSAPPHCSARPLTPHTERCSSRASSGNSLAQSPRSAGVGPPRPGHRHRLEAVGKSLAIARRSLQVAAAAHGQGGSVQAWQMPSGRTLSWYGGLRTGGPGTVPEHRTAMGSRRSTASPTPQARKDGSRDRPPAYCARAWTTGSPCADRRLGPGRGAVSIAGSCPAHRTSRSASRLVSGWVCGSSGPSWIPMADMTVLGTRSGSASPDRSSNHALSFRAGGQGAVDLESLDAFEAVRLFRDRARAARPEFAITDDNASAVAAICQRLDGIPLAIELAAARARMMSIERIAEALADRFHLLSAQRGRAVPRQATLRASVDWSYQLLPEPERALLRRLSVFAGGLTLDAAEHVGAAAEVGGYQVIGLLSALVDKSLAQVNERGDRCRLLETIRAYAAEELAVSGEEHAARNRHLAYFAGLGERAAVGMATSAISSWLAVLDAELDNLRAALDWSLACGQPDTGARLVCAIVQFLHTRCLRVEGLRRCEELLAHGLAPTRCAELYCCAAGLAQNIDLDAALRFGQASVDLGRELGDDRILARGLTQVGGVQRLAEPLVALTTLGGALATSRTIEDDHNVVCVLQWIAGAHLALGRFSEALTSAEEGLATAQRMDWAPVSAG